jgi:hypothetical protein
VPHAVEVGGRVEHMAVVDHQIERLLRPKGHSGKK